MWMGIKKTYATGAFGSGSDWINTIGAWLQANPGQLDVNYIPGVSLEWKSKAAHPDRAQFHVTFGNGYIDALPVFSPAWKSDPSALFPDDTFGMYGFNTGSAGELQFAIDTFTGRAWMSGVAAAEGNGPDIVIFDVLQRSHALPVDCVSTVVLAYIGIDGSSSELYNYSLFAYRVSDQGVREKADFHWIDGVSLTTPLMSLKSFYNGSNYYNVVFPPGSPQKMLLPLQLISPGALQPHSPLTIASFAQGPGFTADEVLATIDNLRVEYRHDLMVALYAPLPANWTVAA